MKSIDNTCIDKTSIILVGAGNLGGAMLRSWIAAGKDGERICVIDPLAGDELQIFCAEHHITVSGDADGLEAPDLLMIAVKPQMMETVLPSLQRITGSHTVAVSVAAGTTMRQLEDGLGIATIVRVMPNTPSMVGRGMSVGCAARSVSDQQRALVANLFEASGKFEWVINEHHIDAVTAVSGSGPAYVFHLVECMAEAGIAAGLPADLAMTLARQTVCGAGELLHQSEKHVSNLRENVTSPGGTTAAALAVLMETHALADLMKRAVVAAKNRSEALSK